MTEGDVALFVEEKCRVAGQLCVFRGCSRGPFCLRLGHSRQRRSRVHRRPLCVRRGT